MPPQLRLNAVAFISPQNQPILIRTFSKQDELKYHYIAHTSLDVIEERGAPQNAFERCKVLIRLVLSKLGDQVYGVLPWPAVCDGGCGRLWLHYALEDEDRGGIGIVGLGRSRRGDPAGEHCYFSLPGRHN